MPVTAPLRHPLAARRTQRCFHFLLQNYLDNFPHALSNRSLQPLSQRTLLAHLHCSASLRHGVFLLCPEPLARRFRAFSFNDFSGEYAFYFSTGIGTEPNSATRQHRSPHLSRPLLRLSPAPRLLSFCRRMPEHQFSSLLQRNGGQHGTTKVRFPPLVTSFLSRAPHQTRLEPAYLCLEPLRRALIAGPLRWLWHRPVLLRKLQSADAPARWRGPSFL